MPAYLRGQARDKLVFVRANDGNVYFGFKTKDYASLPGVTAADIATLGHLLADALPASSFAVLGANSPKPARVKRTLVKFPGANQQGSISTFCSYTAISAALAAKWDLVKGAGGVTLTNNARTVTVCVSINDTGGLYAWPMNATDAAQNAEALGLKLPATISSTNRAFIVTGTSKPRPAKVKKIVDASNASSFSAFCSYDKLEDALDNGFALVKPAIGFIDIASVPTGP